LFLPLTLLTGNNISNYLNEVELVWLSIESSIDNWHIYSGRFCEPIIQLVFLSCFLQCMHLKKSWQILLNKCMRREISSRPNAQLNFTSHFTEKF